MTINLFETFRAVFYAPFYAAHALNAYANEGLDVRLHTPEGPEQTALGLMRGDADVSWGGPMRILHTYETDPDCDLVAFCEVVTRDPFVLVGRVPNPGFKLTDLRQMTLATVSEVPTPWLCLQDDLRRTGIDPGQIKPISHQTMAENEAALRVGGVDVIQVFEPFITNLVESGHGYVLYEAATRGPTSYTTFYTRRRTLDAKPEVMYGMTRAIFRTLKWIHRNEPETIAETIQPFFEALPRQTLELSIRRYKTLGIWGKNPILPRDGFERLKASCISGGLVSNKVAYTACVERTFAEAVLSEDPPSL